MSALRGWTSPALASALASALTGALLVLSGCASSPGPKSRGGGYYQNDGPPKNIDIDLSKIPDAVPKDMPLSEYGNPSSYTALGKRYYVLKSAAGFTQTGLASWYGRQFDGERTSSGEPYDMFAMTAAHKSLPIPTWVRVTNLENHKQVVVKINDRGPFHEGRIIDLSYVAARRLGIVDEGSAPVRIRTVTPETLDQPYVENNAPEHADPPVPLRRAQNPPSDPDETIAPVASLQIGAFSTAGHASRAKAHANAAGVGPVAVIPPSPDMSLYRVRVGPFSSSAAQQRAKQQLAAAGFPVREVKR
ncbi:septal ring lytic transglycosylase RlpA family protein [Salinisphaera sp.]|uniref:septal ring lytic transglycosylase RlpA family protein n=1 Tax=Salinisphaera sp. TaxID=1914330 RepID=UPI002D7A4058|nr:septal ring lytic transglycosylase RlpA family protein [Salinisphaera sp.]HET7314253.1 septal ring lytic transglycosylase RlpA family protein [Salinisphaera sp.]